MIEPEPIIVNGRPVATVAAEARDFKLVERQGVIDVVMDGASVHQIVR
ncbi:MAG: hypothetical protein ACT4QC_03345 [Planctomycetaceae bacterium]